MIVAYINGERVVFDPEEVTDLGWMNGLEYITTEDGKQYYIFESRDQAGEAAREYWENLANNDSQEFACMVGEETLIQWALGRYAGPGSEQVCSLQEWLDLHLDIPEEHFAGYDGEEREFKCKHPDWEGYTVAYRNN